MRAKLLPDTGVGAEQAEQPRHFGRGRGADRFGHRGRPISPGPLLHGHCRVSVLQLQYAQKSEAVDEVRRELILHAAEDELVAFRVLQQYVQVVRRRRLLSAGLLLLLHLVIGPAQQLQETDLPLVGTLLVSAARSASASARSTPASSAHLGCHDNFLHAIAQIARRYRNLPFHLGLGRRGASSGHEGLEGTASPLLVSVFSAPE